jgi:phosphatidylserine/phosphatidylglycerophosphate/cardiolipin synthase-like enzyme
MHRLPETVLLTLCLVQGAQAFDASRTLPAMGTVEVAFSPDGGGVQLIVDAIAAAREQILVQAYTFTSRDLARALVQAHHRKVDVQVIADAEQTVRMEHTVIGTLRKGGVGVWLDSLHSAAHNKVMLIDPGADDSVLITGSYNFTYAAERLNAENILLFRGNAALVRAYLENWKLHRAHASAFELH